jgi:tRNA-dependent cyclodipeptide synthase
MELHSLYGGTKEELEAKHYNIGVGISLGNKWFTLDNTVELVKWALQRTREGVVIYIADSIHAINLEVRGHRSKDRAKREADELGTEFLAQIKHKITETFSPEDAQKISYVKWREIDTPDYHSKVSYLYSLLKTNEAFKLAVETIVRNHTSKEELTFSNEEITQLSTYIIEEMPEQISRVPMGNNVCDAFVYPYASPVTDFFNKIEKGEIFPEIKVNIMDTEPKVFLEVR